jgi:tRNA 2-selenouridine synthase
MFVIPRGSAISCRLEPRLPIIFLTRIVSFQQVATVAQLRDFDEVIDVRSPAEYALDHFPGALNCPVLNDAERAQVGTIYKQESTFVAKRVGAAFVARNIARLVESKFHDRALDWRPLVYCWRGGGRSDAMCEVLRRIGWRAVRLQGGYQAYRRAVVADLLTLPLRHRFCIISGRTGSAKSRILGALAQLDAQVLDLEQLASHRGSVLGEIPGSAQPTQKMFESLLWEALSRLHAGTPVFVEAESRKVGNVQVPGTLISAMRAAPCLVMEVPEAVRIELLLHEYRHFLQDSVSLCRRLDALSVHYGHATIDRWKNMARAAEHSELVAELLHTHYDPAYERSARRNFLQLCSAPVVSLEGADEETLRAAALEILAHFRSGWNEGRLCQ